MGKAIAIHHLVKSTARRRMLRSSTPVFFLSSFVLLLLVPTHGSLLPLSDLWADPFRILEHVPLELERDESVAFAPARVDWKETKDGHMITMDIPGLKREQVKVEVEEENRVLRVTGERKREEEELKAGDHWHRTERSYGKFWRQFKLPDNVDMDSVVAELEDGVLTLTLSKLSPEKVKGPRVVDIAGGEPAKKLKGGSSEAINREEL